MGPGAMVEKLSIGPEEGGETCGAVTVTEEPRSAPLAVGLERSRGEGLQALFMRGWGGCVAV